MPLGFFTARLHHLLIFEFGQVSHMFLILLTLLVTKFLPPNSLIINPSDFPCEVGFLESVESLVEPQNYVSSTWFSLEYVDHEERTSKNHLFEPRFGGHQTLEEREKSFYAKNQTLHCGFVKGPPGHPSTGFDINEKDKAYMYKCKVAVSSCIFGSSDFLRRPTSRLVILQILLEYVFWCCVNYPW